MRRLGSAVVALALVAAGCSSGGNGTHRHLTVFAAASLSDAFGAMAKPYASSHGGDTLTFSFAGSQQLVAQLQQGANADAVATADRPTMDQVPPQRRRTPMVFAGNRLVIAVRPGNPSAIHSLADLARPGLRVVLAAPAVPAGRYAGQALAKAHVTVHPVSLEDSVEGVVTKVSLGEADAGIVYATDATPARHVDTVAIADAFNVQAQYLAAGLSAAGQQFVSFLLSSEGQSVLRRFGFLPPPKQ
ncbi:MAG: molybdate ABC transporter substrate-binding protein [Acidimicrobiia bacterium]|nr:molybdate ABC transporter substrate-binding protein [Acidimicrobiia bacterium]